MTQCAELLKHGVSYHHSGLTDAEKAVIECAYLKQQLLVLCATSTLAAGVNLPARRVLILKPAAWYNAGGTSGWLATDKYRQMTGRAGRANLSAVGESFLLLDSSNKKLDEKQAVERDILSKAASPLLSRLVAPCTRRGENLRRFLLDAAFDPTQSDWPGRAIAQQLGGLASMHAGKCDTTAAAHHSEATEV